MAADAKAFRDPLPGRRAAGGEDLARVPGRAGQDRRASRWNDPPLDPSWTKPDPAWVSRIESAEGLVAERFAFCQTMPLDEFLATAEGLRPSGYRPVRFRPYADGPAVSGRGGLDPRRSELADRIGSDRRSGPPAGRRGSAWDCRPRRLVAQPGPGDRPYPTEVPSRRRRRVRDDRPTASPPTATRRSGSRQRVRRRRPAVRRGDRRRADRGPEAPEGRQADPPHAARPARVRRPASGTPASGASPPRPPSRPRASATCSRGTSRRSR